jgi:hypothetical protein
MFTLPVGWRLDPAGLLSDSDTFVAVLSGPARCGDMEKPGRLVPVDRLEEAPECSGGGRRPGFR